MAASWNRLPLLVAAPLFAVLLGAASPAPTQQQSLINDPEIASAVREQLRRNPLVPADKITVTSVGGVVTLRGIVDSTVMREHVEQVADDVFGVAAIDNELLVQPGDRAGR